MIESGNHPRSKTIPVLSTRMAGLFGAGVLGGALAVAMLLPEDTPSTEMIGQASAIARPALPSFADPVRAGSPAPGDVAVAIGVEDYASLPDAPFAHADATLVRDTLVQTRGVPAGRATLVLDPTRDELRRSLGEAGRSAGEGDTVWVYFAGNGFVNRGHRVLLAADAAASGAAGSEEEEPQAASTVADTAGGQAASPGPTPSARRALASGGLSATQVKSLAGVGGARVVLILDVPFSGTGRDGAAVTPWEGDRTAGDQGNDASGRLLEWRAGDVRDGAPVWEAAGHGLFTWFVVGALRGWADGELGDAADGEVTAEEAGHYVWPMITLIQGAALNPTWVGPADTLDLALTAGALEAAPDEDALGGQRRAPLARSSTLSHHGVEVVRLRPGRFPPRVVRGVKEAPGEALTIELTRPYLLTATEIPRGLWAEVMGPPPEPRPVTCGQAAGGDDLPALCLSWRDAALFCNRLSARDGLRPAYQISRGRVRWVSEADGWRLPTEAEWAWAARAGSRRRFPGVEEPWRACQYGNVADEWMELVIEGGGAFPCDDGFPGPAPVGQLRPNGWGLYDMLGNAAEWLWDGYRAFPSKGLLVDPTGDDLAEERAVRGGSWFLGQQEGDLRGRMHALPTTRTDEIGLRIARWDDAAVDLSQ